MYNNKLKDFAVFTTETSVGEPATGATLEAIVLRGWRSRPIPPSRSSMLQSVPATVEPRYRRGEFYLKIEGLTGPRVNRVRKHGL